MVWLYNEKSLITFDPLWNEGAVKIKIMIIWSYLHLINAAQVSFVALGPQFSIKKTHLNFRLSLRVDDVGIVRICLLGVRLRSPEQSAHFNLIWFKEQIFCSEIDSMGKSSLQRKMINENSMLIFYLISSHFHLLLQNHWTNFIQTSTILGWRGFKFLQMNNHWILKK